MPFSDFAKIAKGILGDYNQKWLGVEYDATVGQTLQATSWQNYEADKDVLPYLQYQTVEDANVRDSHKRLNNIVRRVDDPFWDRYMPLNGWGCRCTTIQLEEATETDLRGFKNLTNDQQPPAFRFNPGRSKQVFSNDHPYFQYDAKYQKYIDDLTNGTGK